MHQAVELDQLNEMDVLQQHHQCILLEYLSRPEAQEGMQQPRLVLL